MSLILEALKKSEQQRRLGEMPTLGTPTLPSRRRRNLLPVLAGLIAVALGAGWWLMRTPAPAPEEAKPARAAAPAALPPTSADRTVAAPVRAERKPAAQLPAPTSAAAAPILPMPTTDRPGAVTPPPNAALVATPGTKPAAPPAATSPIRVPPAPAKPAPTAAPTDAAPKTTATADAATDATSKKKDAVAGTRAAPAKPATATPAATPSPEMKAMEDAIAAKRAAAKPAAPKLPTVWELPYGTRKELPDIKLTMHVYSSAPAERFIVIDGERHVEGDDLGDGVVLREISADGMVLDFKGQRFLYPRDGR
jgi:general secretion pathway protein B